MDAREVLIAWTPARTDYLDTAGKLLVTDRDPRGEQSERYMRTTGGQNTGEWRTASDEELGRRLLALALQLIVYDGLEPQMVYDAFAEIDQFVAAAHPDREEGDRPHWLSNDAHTRWDNEGR